MSKYVYPLKQTLRFIGNQNKKNNVKQHFASIYSNNFAMHNINYTTNINDNLRTYKSEADKKYKFNKK